MLLPPRRVSRPVGALHAILEPGKIIYELNNVAEDPACREIASIFDTRLMAQLKATNYPRASGGGDEFDHYGQSRKPIPQKRGP